MPSKLVGLSRLLQLGLGLVALTVIVNAGDALSSEDSGTLDWLPARHDYNVQDVKPRPLWWTPWLKKR